MLILMNREYVKISFMKVHFVCALLVAHNLPAIYSYHLEKFRNRTMLQVNIVLKLLYTSYSNVTLIDMFFNSKNMYVFPPVCF